MNENFIVAGILLLIPFMTVSLLVVSTLFSLATVTLVTTFVTLPVAGIICILTGVVGYE